MASVLTALSPSINTGNSQPATTPKALISLPERLTSKTRNRQETCGAGLWASVGVQRLRFPLPNSAKLDEWWDHNDADEASTGKVRYAWEVLTPHHAMFSSTFGGQKACRWLTPCAQALSDMKDPDLPDSQQQNWRSMC